MGGSLLTTNRAEIAGLETKKNKKTLRTPDRSLNQGQRRVEKSTVASKIEMKAQDSCSAVLESFPTALGGHVGANEPTR